VTCLLFPDGSLLEISSLAACINRAAGRGKYCERSKFTDAQIAFIILLQGEGSKRSSAGAAVGAPHSIKF
jgi:hypothetical protein